MKRRLRGGRLALLLALLLAAGLTSIAAADHNTVELVSTGPTGGSEPYDARFGDVSSDGSKVFFDTQESLVTADDDGGLRDVYERSGGAVTLISTSPTDLADGSAGADFLAASADGSRVIFESDDSLVPEDSDQFFDVYERAGGTTKILSQGPGGGNGSFDLRSRARRRMARRCSSTPMSLWSARTRMATSISISDPARRRPC